MNKIYKCPHCGAPITKETEQCEYCGVLFKETENLKSKQATGFGISMKEAVEAATQLAKIFSGKEE
jgi:DNA-directed RNA polymerase subunit RPC12/RpoP